MRGTVDGRCVPLLFGHQEDAVDPIEISHEPCPRCGGKLEFKHTVESLRTGSPVHFFQCKDCDHFHTVERRLH